MDNLWRFQKLSIFEITIILFSFPPLRWRIEHTLLYLRYKLQCFIWIQLKMANFSSSLLIFSNRYTRFLKKSGKLFQSNKSLKIWWQNRADIALYFREKSQYRAKERKVLKPLSLNRIWEGRFEKCAQVHCSLSKISDFQRVKIHFRLTFNYVWIEPLMESFYITFTYVTISWWVHDGFFWKSWTNIQFEY